MSSVSKAEFAKFQGVSRSTVTRWVASGRISQNPDNTIDVAAATAQLAKNTNPEPAAASRQYTPGASQPAGGAAAEQLNVASEKISMRTKLARMKKAEFDAQQAAMDLDGRAGSLVKRSDVDYVVDDLLATFANLLEVECEQLGAELAAERDEVRTLEVLTNMRQSLQERLAAHYTQQAHEFLNPESIDA